METQVEQWQPCCHANHWPAECIWRDYSPDFAAGYFNADADFLWRRHTENPNARYYGEAAIATDINRQARQSLCSADFPPEAVQQLVAAARWRYEDGRKQVYGYDLPDKPHPSVNSLLIGKPAAFIEGYLSWWAEYFWHGNKLQMGGALDRLGKKLGVELLAFKLVVEQLTYILDGSCWFRKQPIVGFDQATIEKLVRDAWERQRLEHWFNKCGEVSGVYFPWHQHEVEIPLNDEEGLRRVAEAEGLFLIQGEDLNPMPGSESEPTN